MGRSAQPVADGKLKVVRWFVLCLLLWAVSFGIFLSMTVFELGAMVTGAQAVEVSPTVRYAFEEGDRFSFQAVDQATTCEVVPDRGEPRSYPAYESAGRAKNRKDTGHTAWFTGAAELRCAAPAKMRTPSAHAQDALWSEIHYGFVAAGFVALTVGAAKLYLRRRRQVRVG